MDNDKQRENAIKFMDSRIFETRKRKQRLKMIYVSMRIHESEVSGFVDGLIKCAQQMRIQSN